MDGETVPVNGDEKGATASGQSRTIDASNPRYRFGLHAGAGYPFRGNPDRKEAPMGFTELKTARRQASRTRRPASLASAVLRVDSVDPQAGKLTVTPAAGSASALGMQIGKAYALAIRDNPKAARQPNLNDLLGLPGGSSSASMKVEAGTTLIGDNVQLIDDRLSASWVSLASGPQSDRNFGGPATVLDGHILTRAITIDGATRFRSEIMHPDEAIQVEGDRPALAAALTAALNRSGPGRAAAVVRVSDRNSGENMNDFVRRRRHGDALEETSAAVERYLEERRTPVDALKDMEVAVEVIPASVILIGSTQQDQLKEALSSQDGREGTLRGARKFDLAEVHPDQRVYEPRSDSDEEPSDRQKQYIDAIAHERNRAVPAVARENRAAASAWIDQNRLLLGWAPGQIVVREGIQRDGGDPYDVAVACALSRRTGVQLPAIATPAAPKAPEYMREAASQQNSDRAALLASPLPADPAPDAAAGDLTAALRDSDYDHRDADPSF